MTGTISASLLAKKHGEVSAGELAEVRAKVRALIG